MLSEKFADFFKVWIHLKVVWKREVELPLLLCECFSSYIVEVNV